MSQNKGRVTIPTDVDVIQETLNLAERWGQMLSVTATERISLWN